MSDTTKMQVEEPELTKDPTNKKQDESGAEQHEQTAGASQKSQPDKYQKLKQRFDALKKVSVNQPKTIQLKGLSIMDE